MITHGPEEGEVEIPSDRWNLIYGDPELLSYQADDMVLTACNLFDEVYTLNNIVAYFNLIVRRLPERETDEFKRDFYPFMVSDLIDSVRICMFFENYQKAVLLRKGYVIHKLSKPADTRKAALLIADLKPHLSSMSFRESLGLKNLLSPPYAEIIELPDDIREIVYHLSLYRNEIHLYTDDLGTYSAQSVRDLRKLQKWVHELKEYKFIKENKENGPLGRWAH